jgi:hypothetical protein
MAVVAFACAIAAGCGGTDRSAGPAPRLPARIVSLLAQESRSVAASLDGGDPCMARLRLFELGASTRSAIVSGAVPRPFRRHLQDAVDRLGASLPACVLPSPQPPPPAPAPEQGDEGPGNGHGKAKGHEKGKGKGHGDK